MMDSLTAEEKRLLAIKKEVEGRLAAIALLKRPFSGNGLQAPALPDQHERQGLRDLIRDALAGAGPKGRNVSQILVRVERAGYPYPDDAGTTPVRTRVTNELWRMVNGKSPKLKRVSRGRFKLKAEEG